MKENEKKVHFFKDDTSSDLKIASIFTILEPPI